VVGWVYCLATRTRRSREELAGAGLFAPGPGRVVCATGSQALAGGVPGTRTLAGGSKEERDMLVTTTPGIEGRPVTEYLSIVTAQGVLGVNAFKDVSAGMRNIFGGRARSYENELASGVSDALAEMEKQAAKLGADAVVGVDVDYESVGSNMLMVSASGTAVKLG
jgi:uncharacterized protein YbjQ (UPF0145 family)